MHSWRRLLFVSACLAYALLQWPSAYADSGDTLRLVRARGALRCGVSEGIQGFSIRDASGAWSGIDVDFCRAVAAAALGDASKVRFVALGATARFPALASREIDILARNTTWTVMREAALSIVFAGVLYYDSLAFLVRADGPYAHGGTLDGARICVENGSNQMANLQEYTKAKGWHFTTVLAPGLMDTRKDFLAGTCAVMMGDVSSLAEMLMHLPNAADYTIRPERLTKSPLGPAVRAEDGQWLTLVRAVYAAVVNAEERGLTQLDARLISNGGVDAAHPTYLDETAPIGRALGISPIWAALAVASVGNYGEIFARDLGSGSPLKLDRGPNRLSTDGGLLYAPPFQ